MRDYANTLKGLLVENGLDVPPEPVIPEFVPPPPTESSIMVPSRALVRPLRTAGICLMIVVLSVGILFNAMHHPTSNNSIISGNSDNSTVSEPTTVDPSGRVIVAPGSTPMDQLPSHASESNSNGNEMTSNLNSPATSSETSRDGEVASLDVIRGSAYMSYDTDKVDSSLALVIPDQKQRVPSSPSVSSIAPAIYPVLRHTSKTLFGDSQPHVADPSWTLDNTSYIIVKNPTEFVPPSVYSDRVHTRTEPVIGLLVPASSFNISNSAPDDVVELICGVRNANLVSLSRVFSKPLY